MNFEVDFLYRNMKQKIFVVIVCDRKIRKEIYGRREERRNYRRIHEGSAL